MGERQLALMDELDEERRQVAAQWDVIKAQQQDLERRKVLVDGLEQEKREVAKQRREIEKQRDEMKICERRIRNSLGSRATGPPVHMEDLPRLQLGLQGSRENMLSICVDGRCKLLAQWSTKNSSPAGRSVGIRITRFWARLRRSPVATCASSKIQQQPLL